MYHFIKYTNSKTTRKIQNKNIYKFIMHTYIYINLKLKINIAFQFDI